MAYEKDLSMFRGDDQYFDLEILDSNGDALPLTGLSIWFTVKVALADADPGFLQKTVGSGISVTDAAHGLATVKISRADTIALTTRKNYYYDVQVQDSNGDDATVTFGRFAIELDRTRTQ